ncbi:MAG: GntR family transcriptional regulator [Tatlockia sp.]|nr:GntR family transcriptional regulator [Tatlockia sp.]
MIKIGQFNNLKVIKEVDFGIYLDGEDWGEILLPNKVVPGGTQINDRLDVFIYFDSEDRIVATTLTPLASIGSCASLRAIDINPVGAFLDWGLEKDLLVPGPEQQRPMQKDKFYIVYLKQDNKNRIIGSSKLDHFLDKTPISFKEGDEVNLLIAEKTNLGNKVIINDRHWGLIHSAEIFQTLSYGKRMQGYIKTLREDGKIDVVLRKTGRDNTQELIKRILAKLNKNDGFLPLHDKSSPHEIMQALGESKKSFKNAIGQLYKQGIINIEEEGIRLRNI